MSESKTIGELIRERRLARGLSLGQLATAVGRTAATVRSWERGQHSPAADVLGRLAVALDIEQSELEATLYREPPSLTVVTEATDTAEVTSEATSASGEALIETDDGEGDDETAEIGPVESAPAAAAVTEAKFEAASADDLGVMPRIEMPQDDAVDDEPVDDVAAGSVGVVSVDAADDIAEEGVEDTVEDATVEIEIVEPENAAIGDEATEAAAEDQEFDDGVVDVVLDEMVGEGLDDDEGSELSQEDADERVLVDEPTAAIGPPIAVSPAVESGHVGVAVRAEMLQEPNLPPFLAPLRTIFDPTHKWLYWIRGSLTVVVMVVMLLVLAWAAGELFDGLGEVLDTIESTDEVASSLDI